MRLALSSVTLHSTAGHAAEMRWARRAFDAVELRCVTEGAPLLSRCPLQRPTETVAEDQPRPVFSVSGLSPLSLPSSPSFASAPLCCSCALRVTATRDRRRLSAHRASCDASKLRHCPPPPSQLPPFVTAPQPPVSPCLLCLLTRTSLKFALLDVAAIGALTSLIHC